MKYILPLIIVILLISGIAYYFSQDRQMTKSAPSPTAQASENNDWKEYSFSEIGLAFSAPAEMEVNFESQKYEDTGEAYSHTLFVQKGLGGDSDYYQLYGLYQIAPSSPDDIPLLKADLENTRELTVSGYPAVSGQVKGERNRFVTYIIMPDGRFGLFTAEPTEENKELSDKIIQTFRFEK